MKVENGIVYYTMDDIVDFIDAIKVDGASALNNAAEEKGNDSLKYAAIGYNSALRKVRRELESLNDALTASVNPPVPVVPDEIPDEELSESIEEESDVENDVVSQPDAPVQDTVVPQEEDSKPYESEIPEMGNIPPKGNFAPV